MNLIQKFSFTETKDVMALVHPVHGILFNAANVCEILEIKNTPTAVRKLDDDEKILLKRGEYLSNYDPTPDVGSKTRGGAQSKWFLTEPGLYMLTLSSKKPQAKVFKRWITHEVIPALRRTGFYPMLTDTAQTDTECPANRLFKQIYQIDILTTEEVDLPSTVQARCWYPTELGKLVGISAMRMNMILEIANLQISSYHTGASGKSHKVWTATEEGKAFREYVDMGKEHSDCAPVQGLKWYETVLEHDKVKKIIDIIKKQTKKA